jgi:hypothetical protein
MEIKCPICGRRINLEHLIFENYFGTVKCFSCISMLEVKIRDGVLLDSNCVVKSIDLSHALHRIETVRKLSH